MAWRRAPILSRGVRTGCAARLAILAKRLECGQLAGAFGPPTAPQSGSKLHALQALRDIRLRLPRCEICRLGRLEPAYHYPQFRNAVAANLQGIVSSSPAGLPFRSFRELFTISTTQKLTMLHRRIKAPAQKERRSYLGKSCKPRLNPNGVVVVIATHGRNPVGVGSSRRDGPRVARCSQPWALLQNPFRIRPIPYGRRG